MSNYRDFSLGDVEASSASGLDAFFGDNPQLVTPGSDKAAAEKKPSTRRKIASLDQLEGFVRTASDTLVHKSNQDLWSLQKDAKGDYYIERKFDPAGDPIQG